MNRLGLLFVLLVLATNAPADEWHFEMADESHWVGWKNALVLDENDFPHIAYYDVDGSDNYGFRYAHWNGSEWRVEVLQEWGGGNYVGGVGIDIESNGRPHIAYRAPYNGKGALWYARWDGSEWQREVVDSDPERGRAKNLSFELDSLDRPHIAYTAEGPTGWVMLRYTRWDGSEWRIETIEDTGNVGWHCSLELDSQERPHIAYCDTCFEALKYASWNGSAWEIEIVVSERGAGFGISLEMDSDYYPHIAYVQTHPDDEHDVIYARWDGSQWHFDTVESGRDVSSCISLALDSALRPHITYYDWDTSHLNYARWDGAYWQIADLGMIFKYSCIVMDDEDQPCISCYSWPSPDGVAYLWHEGEFGVEVAELGARPADGGVLIGWSITGDVPAGLRVLRSTGEEEPVSVSGALPGSATRYLDTTAYEASGKGLKPLVYWIKVTETDGTVTRFGPTEPVRIEPERLVLALSAPYPSPAHDVVTISYTLPNNCSVELAVYDLAGRRVATLVDGNRTAGRHEVSWSCADVESGVYLYNLVTDKGSLTKRLVVGR